MSTQKIPYQRSQPKRSYRPMPQKPAKPSNTRLIWLLFSLTGVAMLSATAGALLAVSLATTPLMQSKLSAEDAAVFGQGESISSNPNFRLPQLTRPVSILILGTKVLSTDVQNPPAYARNLGYQATINSFDGLTDTMLLVRFDPETKKLAVLSIPRDTRTYVEGYGVTKINEANYYGGPALSAKATSELLDGVGIDRYVRVNVQGIEKLIDALGGVTVFVPKDMKYQDDSQHLYINLKAGKHHLNGNQALQFLRFRYDENGDIGRIQRQQMLMRALMEQALNPVTLARVPKILSVIQSHLDTNLSVEELMALVGFATQTNRSNVQMLMVPGDFSAPGEYQASYWLPDHDRIQSIMAQHFNLGVGNSLPTNPAYLRVAIQDSTRESAATDGVMQALNQAGYENISVNDPWSEPLNVTRIVAQQGDAESAEALRQVLGVGEVRIESTGALQSDVTIQIGKDWIRQNRP